MDRIIAAAMSFVAALIPGNRRHQRNRPGRHRPDSATRPMVVTHPVRVSAAARVPAANVTQNSTSL